MIVDSLKKYGVKKNPNVINCKSWIVYTCVLCVLCVLCACERESV